jgi:hypothetical protein
MREPEHTSATEITPTDSEELAAAWQATVGGNLGALSVPVPAAAYPAQ